VIVDLQQEKTGYFAPAPDISRVIWKPAELRKEEIEMVLRYYALTTRTDLREQFSEQIRPSIHSHAVRVGKIASRVFLEDGKVVVDGFDYNCTDEARSAQTISEFLSVMLEPLFETRYPEHPAFPQRLGMSEVTALIADPGFASETESMLERDFAHAVEIDRKSFSERPFWWRLGVALSRLAAPVL